MLPSATTKSSIKRAQFLPFHKAAIGEQEIEAVVSTLRSGWLTSGPNAKAFEEEFASAVGARFAVSVNSCTAALHLAAEALGIKEGDEVIVPSMTFTATAEIVSYLKARPVIVDVDRSTQLIDMKDLDRKLSSKTRAVMPVHVAGLPCDLDGLRSVVSQKKSTASFIEDAAHAFPAKYKDRFIGSISEATCFSFYATKTITTGEGGMLTTNDEKLAHRARIMRTHGIDRDAYSRSASQDPWYYEVVDAGFKYNLTDFAAAIGRVQLKKAEEMRARREAIAGRYQAAFKDSKFFMRPVEAAPASLHSWHLYTLQLNLESLTVDRAQFSRALREMNIGTSVHWIPLHRHPFYRKRLGCRDEDFPNASWLADRILSLPIFPDMAQQDVDDVIESVMHVTKNYER
jgi:dTDP-4-amino-4,6-dideoxygalactose transaminase